MIADFGNLNNISTLYYKDTNIHEVLAVRTVLTQTLFRKDSFQTGVIVRLGMYIEMLKADYDPRGMVYTIKIKKTSVKKLPNYKAEACFYYNYIGRVMYDLLNIFKNEVIEIFESSPIIQSLYSSGKSPLENAYNLYHFLINNPTQLANLANVQCIDDNIIQIIL